MGWWCRRLRGGWDRLGWWLGWWLGLFWGGEGWRSGEIGWLWGRGVGCVVKGERRDGEGEEAGESGEEGNGKGVGEMGSGV